MTVQPIPRETPRVPLSVDEIRSLVNRLRAAAINASVAEGSDRYSHYANILHSLDQLHRIETGEPY